MTWAYVSVSVLLPVFVSVSATRPSAPRVVSAVFVPASVLSSDSDESRRGPILPAPWSAWLGLTEELFANGKDGARLSCTRGAVEQEMRQVA